MTGVELLMRTADFFERNPEAWSQKAPITGCCILTGLARNMATPSQDMEAFRQALIIAGCLLWIGLVAAVDEALSEDQDPRA